MAKLRKLTAILLASLLLAAGTGPVLPAAAGQDSPEAGEEANLEAEVTAAPTDGLPSYGSYREGLKLAGTDGPSLDARDESTASGGRLETVSGQELLVLDTLGETVTFTADIPASGAYELHLRFMALPAKDQDIRVGLRINGEYPFTEAASVAFTRVYEMSRGESAGSLNDRIVFPADVAGNEIRPSSDEITAEQVQPFRDRFGIYSDPYLFYFEAGSHEIELELKNESLGLIAVELHGQTEVPSYYDYRSRAGIETADAEPILIQAESIRRHSDLTIFPTRDNSSVNVLPNHPTAVRLNAMGENTWKYSGQWAEWQFEVPEDGLYTLSFRALQDVTRGLNSGRTLYLDGDIPFAEMKVIRFPYSSNWDFVTLGDEEAGAYEFWLEKGVHSLRLEVTTAEIAETLRVIQDTVQEMNRIYRQIIMITGSNPDMSRQTVDTNRDYQLEDKIPGLLEDFARIREQLLAQQEAINELGQSTGNAASFISEITAQLGHFIRQPYTIAPRLEEYRTNVSSLATLLSELREQPLELDYFVIAPAGSNPEAFRAPWWKQVWFRIQALLGSFVVDYNALVSTTENTDYDGEPLSVWVSVADLGSTANTGVFSGRDQAEVLRNLIDDKFTPVSGVPVKVSLVQNSSLLIQAAMAGMGPDAAVFVTSQTPVNLAMRGALLDISQFPDFEEDTKAFYESAMIPFYYEGGVYAMPETQAFDMLFYRTDVFGELGLVPPNTWEEFYAILPKLQQNGMQAGIYQSENTFAALLYQRQGDFYNDSLTATAFDRPEALSAFRQWTGFFADYSMPLVFDFFNRFRTGEMPMAIVSYTNANYLSAGAPELTGLWGMAPVPGTVQPDGSINRAATAGSTASVILKDTQEPEAAYEFIRWWTAADAQESFGNALEQLMGPASRYPTANREAFDKIPWTPEQSDMLKSQWKDVIAIPQVPGNYQISRNLSFAFRAVVYERKNTREVLNEYNIDINDEITRKRLEFGLPVEVTP